MTISAVVIEVARAIKIAKYHHRRKIKPSGLQPLWECDCNLIKEQKQSLKTFRGEASLSTWIYRIATNTALDRLRSLSFQRIIQDPTNQQGSDYEPEIVDRNVWTGEKTPPVEHQIFRKEMNACICSFIEKLPEGYRTVLILSEFEGLRNTEISEIMCISLDTVKIRLHRAREKLKEEFIAKCGSYWVEDNEFLPELRLV